MALNADTLIDRLHLKSQVTRWRVLAIVFGVLALLVILDRFSPHYSPMERNFIARLTFEGFIGDDKRAYELIDEVAEDSHAKAVVVWLDTPGGSAVGGEEIFLRLRALSAKKPVVAVMRSISASAGYMIALGADRIFAREGTITGSIGVIIETAEITEMAKKLGIEPIIIKSAPLKASPSPFEKVTPESQKAVQDVVGDFYARFVDMVVERRKLPRTRVLELADGRVYSGRRAVDNKLIDAIGGEEDAIAWLQAEKKLTPDLEVRDVKVEEPENLLKSLTESVAGKFFYNSRSGLDGLVSIWHPNLD